jgi:prolyl-tRNA synthetase
LVNSGIDVLLDDRSESAGSKFAAADLLGIPIRLIISPRNGEQIEWKKRGNEKSELLDLNIVLDRLKTANA